MSTTFFPNTAIPSHSRFLIYRVLGHVLLMLAGVKMLAVLVTVWYQESIFLGACPRID